MATPCALLIGAAAAEDRLGSGSASALASGSAEAEGCASVEVDASAVAEGVEPVTASGAASWLRDAWSPAVLKPSLGRIRNDTSPMASATTPTARIGQSRTRSGVEAVRWTPCREAVSGTLSNSSRAYLVMVDDILVGLLLEGTAGASYA